MFLAIAIVLLVALAAGCGSGTSGAGGEEGAESSVNPKRGGTLNVGQSEEVLTLDPLEAFVPASINAVSIISEPLFKEDFDGENVPWLAEKAETSDQDRIWTIHLRKGVQFSDGKPMTAADVVFSLERARSNESWDAFTEGITKVEAPNSSTVVITNAKPAPELSAILSLWPFGIVPKDLDGMSEKEFSSHPIATGPFMLESWKRGETIAMTRNPHYWKKGLPYLDKLVLHTVPDANSRTSQLQAGQLQAIEKPPWSQIEAINSSPDTQAVPSPEIVIEDLLLNSKVALFQDERVREAINLAIDREGLVKAALFDNGEPAGSFVPPAQAFHDPSIEPPEQDVEKAKKLLAEAVADGTDPTMTMMVSAEEDFWTAAAAAQIVQQNLEDVGFHVKLQKLEASTWVELLFSGKYEASFSYSYNQMPTPAEAFGYYAGFNGYGTFAGVDKIASLVGEVLSTPNLKRREELYFAMQQQLYEEKFVIPAVYKPYMWAAQSNVHGLYVGKVAIPWFSQTSIE